MPRPLDTITRLLDDYAPDARERVALVVGTGMSVAAAHAANVARDESWGGLLDNLARRYDAAALTATSYTLRWERLLCGVARVHDISAHRAESRLQHDIADALRHAERALTDADRAFYQRLGHAGYDHILSFNFDRRLERSHPSSHYITGKTALTRRAVVATSGPNTCTIWYPHGDTRRASTIKLGVRAYGAYVAQMATRFDQYRARQRSIAGVLQEIGAPDARAQAAREHQYTAEAAAACTWVDVALGRPLIMAGLGLSSDEWTWWWLLNQRARNYARRDMPPAIALCYNGVPDNLRGHPADLTVVDYAGDGDQLWADVAALPRYG